MISEEEKKIAHSLLIDLRMAPSFPMLLNYLNSLRPEVPMYRWHEDNIAEIKACSLQQQGFDKLLNILKPK